MIKSLKNIYSKFEEIRKSNLKEMEDKAFSINGEKLGYKQRVIREYLLLKVHLENSNTDKTFTGLLGINKLLKDINVYVEQLRENELPFQDAEIISYVITALQIKTGCDISFYSKAFAKNRGKFVFGIYLAT